MFLILSLLAAAAVVAVCLWFTSPRSDRRRAFRAAMLAVLMVAVLFLGASPAHGATFFFSQTGGVAITPATFVPTNAFLATGCGIGVGVPVNNTLFVSNRGVVAGRQKVFFNAGGVGNTTFIQNRGLFGARSTFFQQGGGGGNSTLIQNGGLFGRRQTFFQQNAVGGTTFFSR